MRNKCGNIASRDRRMLNEENQMTQEARETKRPAPRPERRTPVRRLPTTLAARAARADETAFAAVLAKVPDVEPEPPDRW